jgi:hypothetical protein
MWAQPLRTANKPLSCTGQTSGNGGASVCRRSIDYKPDQHRNLQWVCECLVSLAAVGLPIKSPFFVRSSIGASRPPVLQWC